MGRALWEVGGGRRKEGGGRREKGGGILPRITEVLLKDEKMGTGREEQPTTQASHLQFKQER